MNFVPTRAGDGSWNQVDTILIVVLTVLAGGLRFVGITQPGGLVFDEHYAADACLFVFGPELFCSTTSEIGLVHPPLGKWLIGAGIAVFGFNPAGWRVAPLIAGTLSVAVLYVLARRILRSTLGASIAAGLLAFDFLHFVMSRTAMLDVFVVLFGLVSFLCLRYDGDRGGRPADPRPGVLQGIVERRWLLGAGLAGGAAVASKWSGAYLLAAVFLLACWHAAAGAPRGARRYRWLIRHEGVPLVVALVLVPAGIYIASYTGTLQGSLFAPPWADGSWAQSFLARQRLMLEHHTGALYTHPYMSPAWSWLLIKRPVLFYFREPGGAFQEILAFGNPLVWWTGALALVATAWRVLPRRSVRAPETVIVAGFAAGYVPWLLITREEAFLYYLLPALPFLYLALAHVVSNISARSIRAAAIGGLAAASIGLFFFFRPVLVGTPLSHQQWERRMFFTDCGPALSGSHKRPVDRPIPPPPGWCWV